MKQKPALNLEEQVELLKQRGLVIDDDDMAVKYLYDTNYYRLTGFARQFQRDPRHGNNAFHSGTSLAMLADLAETDARFGRVLAHALAAIECTVRSRLALHLALEHGETAFYLRTDTYVAGLDDKVADLIESIGRELRRDKGRTIARYAPDREDLSAVPIWVASEVLSFGTVSRLLELLRDPGTRDAVAESFSERRGKFVSTVHSLAVLRNRCAHHGQIWHRPLTIQTPVDGRHRKRAGVPFSDNGPFPAVLAIQRLLAHISGGRECSEALDLFIEAAPSRYMEGILKPDPK